jgi:hypothetical protein
MRCLVSMMGVLIISSFKVSGALAIDEIHQAPGLVNVKVNLVGYLGKMPTYQLQLLSTDQQIPAMGLVSKIWNIMDAEQKLSFILKTKGYSRTNCKVYMNNKPVETLVLGPVMTKPAEIVIDLFAQVSEN